MALPTSRHSPLRVCRRFAAREFGAFVAPSVKDAHGHVVLRLSMGRLLDRLVRNMEEAAAATADSSGRGGAELVPEAAEVASSSGRGATGATSGRFTAAAAAAAPPPQPRHPGHQDNAGGGGGRPRMYLYSGHDTTIFPLLAALGQDTDTWPPYVSNLVFELWELPAAPAVAAATPAEPAVARRSSGGAAGSGPREPGGLPAPPGAAAGATRHVVKVLYNRRQLDLPHCPRDPSTGKVSAYPSLDTFREEVIGPFILSDADFRQACTVRPTHEGSLPKPAAVSSATSEDD